MKEYTSPWAVDSEHFDSVLYIFGWDKEDEETYTKDGKKHSIESFFGSDGAEKLLLAALDNGFVCKIHIRPGDEGPLYSCASFKGAEEMWNEEIARDARWTSYNPSSAVVESLFRRIIMEDEDEYERN